ncbi:MAG: hypothetical protein KatS3mg059_0290 [Thermomicrobiales bacterium]|nr:MAG: hypothetical protein KatS3mg059_0290 [Thermomicrobiales bacterium]
MPGRRGAGSVLASSPQFAPATHSPVTPGGCASIAEQSPCRSRPSGPDGWVVVTHPRTINTVASATSNTIVTAAMGIAPQRLPKAAGVRRDHHGRPA